MSYSHTTTLHQNLRYKHKQVALCGLMRVLVQPADIKGFPGLIITLYDIKYWNCYSLEAHVTQKEVIKHAGINQVFMQSKDAT